MYCSASQGIASASSASLIAGSESRLTMTAWPASALVTVARRKPSESSSCFTVWLTSVGSATAPSWMQPSGTEASPAARSDQPLAAAAHD